MPPLADRRARCRRARHLSHPPAALAQAPHHEDEHPDEQRERAELNRDHDTGGLVLGQAPQRTEQDRAAEEDDEHPQDGVLVQRMSFRSMNLIASRHETSAKPIRNERCHTSTQPSKPNTAARTSSTQWYSGLRLLAIWAHLGRSSSGKNVPATRNMGVSRPLCQYEKLSIALDLAAMKMPKNAQPRPESPAMNGTSSIPQLGSRPNTTATSIGTQP